MLADFVSAATLYAPSLPVVTGILTGNVANPTTQSIFSNLYRSDHVGFWLHGYNAILLGDTANFRNPNYHNANDLPSTLDFPFMTQVVKGSVGFVAEQAGLVTAPEPSTGLLLTVGLLGICIASRRRARDRRAGAKT